MNYKIVIAIFGFTVLLIAGLLLIIGTLIKWKPLIDPNERQWLFSTQYFDRKYFGLSWVIVHNMVIGLIFILTGLAGLLISIHR